MTDKAEQDAKKWRGKKAFEFYVNLNSQPEYSGNVKRAMDESTFKRFKAAVAYEQKLRGSKSISQSFADGMEKNSKTHTTKTYKEKGTPVTEVIRRPRKAR